VVFYEMLTGEVPMGRFKPPSAKADVDRRIDPVVLKSLEREPEDRYQSAGEVKEEVAGLHSRPAPSKAPVAARSPGRSILYGCLVALIAGVAILAILILAFIPLSARSAVPATAVTSPPYRPSTYGEVSHYLTAIFDLDKVWPAETEFPAGSSPGTEYQGEDALKRSGLPRAMLPDLKTIRIVGCGDGQVFLLGIKFKNEVARRQWTMDRGYQAVISSWNCQLDGESDSAVFLKHNGSNKGAAIAETLWGVIKKKWGKLQ